MVLVDIVLLVAASVCMIWPNKIQEHAMKRIAKQGGSLFENSVKSPFYQTKIRLAGFIALLGFLLLTYMIVKRWM